MRAVLLGIAVVTAAFASEPTPQLAPASDSAVPPAELLAHARGADGIHRHDGWLAVSRTTQLDADSDARQRQVAMTRARGQASEALMLAWAQHHFAGEWEQLSPIQPWLLGHLQLKLAVHDADPRAETERVILAVDLSRAPLQSVGAASLLDLCLQAGPQHDAAAAEGALRLDPGNLRLRFTILHGPLQVPAENLGFSHLSALLALRQKPQTTDDGPQPGHARAYARALIGLRDAAEAEQIVALLQASAQRPASWAAAAQWAGLAAVSGEDDTPARWLAQARQLAESDPLGALLAARRALALGVERTASEALLSQYCAQLGLEHAAARYQQP